MTTIIYLVILLMQTKKDLIVKAWIKLFWKFWPRRTSVDQIVSEAKVAKWTFYLYFKNKEELYESIIDSYFSYWEKKGLELIKAYPDLKERILARLTLSLKFFERKDIIRNIIFWNEDFFIWKVDKDYLESLNLRLLKSIFWDDNNIDRKLFSKISCFYLNLLNIKDKFENDEDFENFTIEFAWIIVNWLFSDYKNMISDFEKDKMEI